MVYKYCIILALIVSMTFTLISLLTFLKRISYFYFISDIIFLMILHFAAIGLIFTLWICATEV